MFGLIQKDYEPLASLDWLESKMSRGIFLWSVGSVFLCKLGVRKVSEKDHKQISVRIQNMIFS